MPPKKSTLVQAAAAAVIAATTPSPIVRELLTEPFMRLNMVIGNNIWKTWSKSKYTPLQQLLELLDNSIASKVNAQNVHLCIDFERGVAYIEDDGTGFPTNEVELTRCFNFGESCPTDLNEHGCGLKQALASLDPSNTLWRVVWKCNGVIYEVRAPYSGTLDVHTIETWPGKMTRDSGAYIEFPIRKDRFAELYATKNVKCLNPITKIREELSEIWMLNKRVKAGEIRLILNDTHIAPLSMTSFSDYARGSARPKVVPMSSGASVEIYQWQLHEEEKAVPKSRFKRTATATGYYLFKNGRLIEHIGSGCTYEQLYGGEKHPSQNGFFAFINMIGTQEQLPHTVPTKNEIPTSDLRSELFDIIKANVKIEKEPQKSENSLVQEYIAMRKNNRSEILEYKIEEKVILNGKSDEGDEFQTPQIDIVESDRNNVYVYEAKKSSRVEIDAIRQLYANYILASYAFNRQEKTIIPILLIESDRLDFPCVSMLAGLLENSRCGFPLRVMNYKGNKLYGE